MVWTVPQRASGNRAHAQPLPETGWTSNTGNPPLTLKKRSRNNPCNRLHAMVNPGAIARFVRASLADNTRRAYAADLRHFLDWGGRLPASPKLIASYLAEHAETLCTATLNRRRAALAKAHDFAPGDNPARSALVNATMRGIKRELGRPQRQAKPLIGGQLDEVLASISKDLPGLRDRALILVGFAGALRRSELVDLDLQDLKVTPDELILMVRRSKTDPYGHGHSIMLPRHKRAKLCPVRALAAWMRAIDADTGAIFRPIDRHGNVKAERLSAEAVSVIVKQRAQAAGLDPRQYSGHSLRAGYVTSQAQAGVPEWRIRRQTRHASNAMLARYIRDGAP